MSRMNSHRSLLTLMLALCVALMGTGGAQAQGFLVKPMRMEFAAPAGRIAEIGLNIRNTLTDAPYDIDLSVAELTQDPTGGWSMVPRDPDGAEPPYSCASWIRLPTSRLTIGPLQDTETTVRIQIPPAARGVYYAALIAETPVPPDAQGVTIRIRFLIPIIIQIEGRTVRQQVTLSDLNMEFQPAAQDAPSTTRAGLVIANNGGTYSRVGGQIAVEAFVDGKWRPVTRMDVPEKSILPGITLNLTADLQRRLPTGLYRLRGQVFVDGRRIPPLSKEVTFDGDPEVEDVALDTALILEPAEFTLEVLPGATRTSLLTIENPGTQPVTVSIAAATPSSLSGVELNGMPGSDLSAEPWTQIRPAEFTISPGRKQNVRVLTKLPEDGDLYPNYYADLVLKGTYADGQSAGDTRSIIHLANTEGTSAIDGVVELLSLAEGDTDSSFIVNAKYVNTGNVDVSPKVTATIVDPRGIPVRTEALGGDEGILLPLGRRSYSASFDFAGLDPGYYALGVKFELGDGQEITAQRILRLDVEEVEAADGTVTAKAIVSVDAEAPYIPDTEDGGTPASDAGPIGQIQ